MGNVQSKPTDSKSALNKLEYIQETTSSVSSSFNGVNYSNNAQTSPSSLRVMTQSSEEQTDDVFSEGDVFKDPIEPRIPTFFSTMQIRYLFKINAS